MERAPSHFYSLFPWLLWERKDEKTRFGGSSRLNAKSERDFSSKNAALSNSEFIYRAGTFGRLIAQRSWP